MEDLMILGIVFIGSITALLGGFMGLKWVKYRALDGSYVKKKVGFYQDLAGEYEADAKHWRGKWNQRKQDIQIEGDYDLTDGGDVASVVKLVLPEIMHLLPSDIQKHAKGFLDNPDLVNMAVKLYEQHPEDIQRLLAGFLKKTGIKKDADPSKSADTNPTEEEISNYA